MRLRCPRCQAKIAAPDDWAGRTIRCRGCNKAFRVPKPTATIAPTRAEPGVDLDDLASLERTSEELDERETAEAEREVRELEAERGAGQSAVRTCPFCGKTITAKDPRASVICSSCWQPIPAEGEQAPQTAVGFTEREVRIRERTGFYSGLASTFTYPLGASGSLLTSIIVCFGAIVLPVAMIVGIARAVEHGKVGGVTEYEHLSGVQWAVVLVFYAEVFFFAGVGVNAFLDVLRATSNGEERPPGLAWNPLGWGDSILGYLSLILYYALFALLALKLSAGRLAIPTTGDEFRALLTPAVIAVGVVFTFFVPMNLIGIGVGSIVKGLNPMRVVQSIAATHVHYVFLFALLITHVAIFVVAFSAVLAWFGGVVRKMTVAAGAGDLIELSGGLLSWGLVMTFGFYCTYVLGRLHGLFARSFRRELAF